jgi:Cu2+-exporting ATPase
MSVLLKDETETRSARSTRRVCRHCGAPSRTGEFCCAGCAYVFRLVHEQGLEAYYRFKDAVTPPADPALLEARDYAWLTQAARAAEEGNASATPSLVVEVQGLSCAACVWLIEKLFLRTPGAGRVDVNAQTGRLRMSWQRGVFDAEAFARTLQSFGYLLGPVGVERSGGSESRDLVRRIGLCTAFAMNVMLFTLPTYFGMEATFEYAPLFGTLSLVFGTLSLLAGGGYFLVRAVRALRVGALHIDLPIALGIVGAYAGSLYGWAAKAEEYVYFDFVSGFILLMLVGRWAQVAAVERNQRRLLSRQPTPLGVPVIQADDVRADVAPEQLKVGMVFLAVAGRVVPVESRLIADEATFSLAWINGEAEPRVFRAGQRVPAGAVALDRSEARLEAVEGWDTSLLAKLLRPSQRADYRHRLVERIVQGYLIGILGVSVLAGLGWWFATGDWAHTGAVVTAVLVVSCPCALGLAIPLADEMATVALRRRGVFVRAGDLWPRLARIRKVVFDKTGTLTLETPVLRNPDAVSGLSAESKSALLALVRDNPHPVSRALHEALLVEGRVEPLAGDVQETVGAGVALGEWTLGRAEWCAAPGGAVHATQDAGVVLRWRGREIAVFQLMDTARPDARGEVAALVRRGLEIFVLSGDRREKVAALMRDLGLPVGHGLGGLSPEGKASWLEIEGPADALMLGDGANDSLAFDRALCRGTPVVHRGLLSEKADFYYLGRGIAGIRALFEIDAARRRTGGALLIFMIAYNLVAVGLAVAGLMNPLFAAVLMPLSSLATLVIVGMGMRQIWDNRPESSDAPASGASLS